jgi:hypothetical protein
MSLNNGEFKKLNMRIKYFNSLFKLSNFNLFLFSIIRNLYKIIKKMIMNFNLMINIIIIQNIEIL